MNHHVYSRQIPLNTTGLGLGYSFFRSVKSAAAEWNMEPVLWIFQDDQTTDADVAMML